MSNHPGLPRPARPCSPVTHGAIALGLTPCALSGSSDSSNGKARKIPHFGMPARDSPRPWPLPSCLLGTPTNGAQARCPPVDLGPSCPALSIQGVHGEGGRSWPRRQKLPADAIPCWPSRVHLLPSKRARNRL